MTARRQSTLDQDEIIEGYQGSDSGGAFAMQEAEGKVSDEACTVAARDGHLCGHLSGAGRLREWPGHRDDEAHPDQRTHCDTDAHLGNMAHRYNAFPDGV